MLKISNLQISYGDLEILKHANFEANIGITCITGKSGSGKSSLLNAMTHQIEFKAKAFTYNNFDLLEEDNDFTRQNIAYLTQNNNFINDLTCYENIRFFSSFNNIEPSDEEIYDLLTIVGLEQLSLETYPETLSGGEKQRLAIAQSLAKGAEILLCDEITASLDQSAKNEVLLLLRKLVTNYGKMIIMTSHDEDVYDVVDKIYHIENGKLTLVKNNQKQNYKELNVLKSKDVSLKLIHRYILSKLDRQKGFSILYSVITSIVVSICAFLTFFTITSLLEQNTILNRLCQNQIYIINQTELPIGNNSYSYYTNNLIFDEEVVNQIESIEGISSLYPYYWIPLVNPQELYQNHTITLLYEDREDKIINVTSAPFDFAISPYYDEQGFEEKMEVINVNNVNYGAYINHIFLEMTGLTKEDLIGTTLKVPAYIPVSYKETTFIKHISDTDESFEQIVHEQIGSYVEIEIPIIGFVDFWYNDDWAQGFIYCPINYMEQLRLDVTNSLSSQNITEKWAPNAYIGFVNNLDQMENVNISLRNINESIATGNKYTDNKAMYEQKRYVEITAAVSVVVVLGAGALLSYVYGIYYYQKNINDINYLKRNKFTTNEFKKLITYDCFYQVLINILFALPITVVISYFGQIYLNMFRFDIFSTETFTIFLLLVIYIIVQSMISRFYYYSKAV